MAHLMLPSGEDREVLPQGARFTMAELRNLVKGRLEVIELGNGACLVVDFDGWDKELPDNKLATRLYGPLGIAGFVGPALLLEASEREGVV